MFLCSQSYTRHVRDYLLWATILNASARGTRASWRRTLVVEKSPRITPFQVLLLVLTATCAVLRLLWPLKLDGGLVSAEFAVCVLQRLRCAAAIPFARNGIDTAATEQLLVKSFADTTWVRFVPIHLFVVAIRVGS